ncbi:MAG: 7-cyano-7-deazaguanine synthase [Acidobacteria bacterium]|nr:MAG: 7-cyano-7-deazaguanine synthase [Acidobacteriota bacterium]
MNRLLLLSGGMDSIALAWHLRPSLCLTIDYGQLSAEGEKRAATAVCQELGLRHCVLCVDCSSLGSGDMAGRAPSAIAPVPEWWPFRNQLLITLGATVAVEERCSRVVIGSVANDSSHADGRPSFVDLMDRLLQLQEGGIALEAPALGETTVELCRRVAVPHSVLGWAHSCHVAPVGCGACRGCCKHRETMRELGYGEY